MSDQSPAPEAHSFTTFVTTDNDTIDSETVRDLSCLIKLKSPPAANNERRSSCAIDIVLVVDRSGSMLGEKIALVQTSIESIINKSTIPEDRFAIVTFANTPLMLQEFTSDRQSIIKKLHAIKAGGGTNIPDAFNMGLDVMRTGGTRHTAMIFLTDGMSNQGMGNAEFEAQINEVTRKSIDFPASFYAIGFGSDCDSSMLKLISSCTPGNSVPTFSWIETEDQVASTFGEVIGSITTTIAWNVTLDIQAGSGCRIIRVDTGAGNVREIQAEKRFQLCFGAMFEDEVKHVLVDLSVDKTVEQDGQILGNCSISYMNINGTTSHAPGSTLTINRKRDTTVEASKIVLLEIQDQRNRIAVANAMRIAENQAEHGDLRAAAETLQDPNIIAPGGTLGYGETLKGSLQNQSDQLLSSTDSRTTSMRLGVSADQQGSQRGADHVTPSQEREANITNSYVKTNTQGYRQ